MTRPRRSPTRFEALRPRLLRVAYGQLGSPRRGRGRRAGGVAAAAAGGRRARSATSRLADHHRLAARAGRPALRPRAARGLRRPVAARAVVDEPAPRSASRWTRRSARAARRARDALGRRAHRVRLHDVFGYDFAAVADVLGPRRRRRASTPRGRAGRRGAPARSRPRREQQRELIGAFRPAARAATSTGCSVLHPDAVLTTDGGGSSPRPASRSWARQGGPRRWRSRAARGEGRIVDVNGLPGLLARAATASPRHRFTVDDGRITAITSSATRRSCGACRRDPRAALGARAALRVGAGRRAPGAVRSRGLLPHVPARARVGSRSCRPTTSTSRATSAASTSPSRCCSAGRR